MHRTKDVTWMRECFSNGALRLTGVTQENDSVMVPWGSLG